ncbi:hypothetical protein ACMC5R_09150 [Deferribacteres bacterium DY0037]
MINRNQVLRLKDDSVVRVLWIEHAKSLAYVFNIESPSMPYMIDSKDLFKNAEEIEDPFSTVINEDEISERNLEKINKNWRLISDLVSQEPEIFNATVRGRLVSEVERSTGTNRKYIYLALKRFWQRGMTKSALMPDYKNCGTTANKVESKKPGRKKKYADELGNGVKITPEIEKIFFHMFRKHNKNASKTSLMRTYNDMITEYFEKEIYSPGKKFERPSYAQFWWRYKKWCSPKEQVIAKKGSKKFNKDIRATMGNSSGEATGPGDMYQIDATVADIYLVSSMNREWIIGRPVLYFCVDVFTRVISGIYVGLSGPSLEGARLAIMNCAEDKVEFCKSYGIDIEPEDWPSKGLPKCFLGDNGEMRGVTPENSIRAFNIEVKTTGSYRADMKGIVEKKFHTIQEQVKPVAPGFVLPDYTERGGRDYRKDAVITLDEFTQIIIRLILMHHDRLIDGYAFNDDVIDSGIDLTPKELWKWGIEHGSGALKTVSQTQLKASLLPHHDATVTRKGICLHNDVHYELPLGHDKGWFLKKKGKSPQIKLSYNPRDLHEAYIFYNNEYLPVSPTPSSNIAKYNFEEIEFYTEYMNKKKAESEKNRFQRLAHTTEAIDAIINNAKIDAELNAETGKKNLKDIKINRKAELLRLNNKAPETTETEKPEKAPESYEDDILDMLSEIRNEGDDNE